MTTQESARTNLTSRNVHVDASHLIGQGQFRLAYSGSYIGGNRNQQDAVCKRFKNAFEHLEDEFYQTDSEATDKAIQLALQWNQMCEHGKEILVTKGDVMQSGIYQYLVEPLIRNFTKYTSNSGWIASNEGWEAEAMEAFSHFTYHCTGGNLIVCDLQGRYRFDRFSKQKSRFELTDIAICSRSRKYGPTDLGEKGIESFFANHCCNKFCQHNNKHWARPRNPQQWFEPSHKTSMLSSKVSPLLRITNAVKFTSTLAIYIETEESDDDSYY